MGKVMKRFNLLLDRRAMRQLDKLVDLTGIDSKCQIVRLAINEKFEAAQRKKFKANARKKKSE